MIWSVSASVNGLDPEVENAAYNCGSHGGIILTESIEQSIAFVNDYASEHLQIHAKSPYDYLGAIENAGEILLGEHAPIVIGNFTLGPNAVLPTNAASEPTPHWVYMTISNSHQ